MRTVISTVGTSLITNYKKQKETGAGYLPNRAELFYYLQHASVDAASAETNSLSRIVQRDDRLIFLHSHTEEGTLCAEVLKSFYEKKDFDCAVFAIQDLTYKESRFKMRGLRALVGKMVELIREEKRKGRMVIINATGGFKAEIAYAVLVGLLFDVPVYYIHEAFKEIIEMPPSPITWDMGLLAEHEDFFQWLNDDLRTETEVNERMNSLPQELRLLITEEDGYAMLTPAGEAFYEAYRSYLEQLTYNDLFLSSAAQEKIVKGEPGNLDSILHHLKKLTSVQLRRSQTGQVNNSDCLIYPRGHCPERIFYYEREGKVYVCEMASHEDGSYERLLERGVFKNNYSNFLPLNTIMKMV